MSKKSFLGVLLLPIFIYGQEPFSVKTIDSIVAQVNNDLTISKKVYDTSSYEKDDGGDNWDSLYIHREYFYKDGQIVKILGWNKYGDWRNDQLAYYNLRQPIRFSKGESFKGQPDYGNLDFTIYYNKGKDIKVTWLTPKPDNVLSVATDTFLKWAYSLLEKAK